MPEQGRNGKTKRQKRFTDALQQRCMRLLEMRRERCLGQDRIRPVTAVVLARALRHWPDAKHETLRRRVRELVDEMRRQGAPIASGRSGYWAAETVEDFQRTAAFLRRIGLATLATNARLKQTAAHARATRQLRFAPYHAALTGGLSLYMKTAPGSAAPPQSAPVQPEESGHTWPDSLFATA